VASGKALQGGKWLLRCSDDVRGLASAQVRGEVFSVRNRQKNLKRTSGQVEREGKEEENAEENAGKESGPVEDRWRGSEAAAPERDAEGETIRPAPSPVPAGQWA